jgi:hypothetical protein
MYSKALSKQLFDGKRVLYWMIGAYTYGAVFLVIMLTCTSFEYHSGIGFWLLNPESINPVGLLFPQKNLYSERLPSNHRRLHARNEQYSYTDGRDCVPFLRDRENVHGSKQG